MKARLLLMAMIFAISTPLTALDYYVNGAIGSDDNNGSANKSGKAYKTITRAVESAMKGDRIFVEGIHDEKPIVYKESIFIGSDKIALKIQGRNNPIIDGNYEEKTVRQFNGFTVYGEKIVIDGFTIRNFLKGIQSDESISGAGIFTNTETTKHVFENNTIENCNYGIFLDGPTFCEVNNNVIKNIKRISQESDFYDGTGIMLYPAGPGIEGNNIGGKGANTIDSVGLFGVCLGAEGQNIRAGMTKISNNKISNSGNAAIALLDFEGMVEVTLNTLKNNKSAFLMTGLHYDTWVGDNTIENIIGESLVEVDNQMHGMMLYNIWKENDNKFKLQSYAAKKPETNEIVITKKGGFIRSSMSKAQQDAGDKFEVEPYKVGQAKTD